MSIASNNQLNPAFSVVGHYTKRFYYFRKSGDFIANCLFNFLSQDKSLVAPSASLFIVVLHADYHLTLNFNPEFPYYLQCNLLFYCWHVFQSGVYEEEIPSSKFSAWFFSFFAVVLWPCKPPNFELYRSKVYKLHTWTSFSSIGCCLLFCFVRACLFIRTASLTPAIN